MRPWFKMHLSVLDAQVVRAMDARLFRFWVLAVAAQECAAGMGDLTVFHLIRSTGLYESRCRRNLARLAALGLATLEGDAVSLHWPPRDPPSSADTTCTDEAIQLRTTSAQLAHNLCATSAQLARNSRTTDDEGIQTASPQAETPQEVCGGPLHAGAPAPSFSENENENTHNRGRACEAPPSSGTSMIGTYPVGAEHQAVGEYAQSLTADWSWGGFVDFLGANGHSSNDIRAAIDYAYPRDRLTKPYVQAMLERWAREGRDRPPAAAPRPERKAPGPAPPPAFDREAFRSSLSTESPLKPSEAASRIRAMKRGIAAATRTPDNKKG